MLRRYAPTLLVVTICLLFGATASVVLAAPAEDGEPPIQPSCGEIIELFVGGDPLGGTSGPRLVRFFWWYIGNCGGTEFTAGDETYGSDDPSGRSVPPELLAPLAPSGEDVPVNQPPRQVDPTQMPVPTAGIGTTTDDPATTGEDPGDITDEFLEPCPPSVVLFVRQDMWIFVLLCCLLPLIILVLVPVAFFFGRRYPWDAPDGDDDAFQPGRPGDGNAPAGRLSYDSPAGGSYAPAGLTSTPAGDTEAAAPPSQGETVGSSAPPALGGPEGSEPSSQGGDVQSPQPPAGEPALSAPPLRPGPMLPMPPERRSGKKRPIRKRAQSTTGPTTPSGETPGDMTDSPAGDEPGSDGGTPPAGTPPSADAPPADDPARGQARPPVIPVPLPGEENDDCSKLLAAIRQARESGVLDALEKVTPSPVWLPLSSVKRKDSQDLKNWADAAWSLDDLLRPLGFKAIIGASDVYKYLAELLERVRKACPDHPALDGVNPEAPPLEQVRQIGDNLGTKPPADDTPPSPTDAPPQGEAPHTENPGGAPPPAVQGGPPPPETPGPQSGDPQMTIPGQMFFVRQPPLPEADCDTLLALVHWLSRYELEPNKPEAMKTGGQYAWDHPDLNDKLAEAGLPPVVDGEELSRVLETILRAIGKFWVLSAF